MLRQLTSRGLCRANVATAGAAAARRAFSRTGAAHRSLETGFVGLPNVGKSSLFNAITATVEAQVKNFPFCTIDPNRGRAVLPDPVLDQLAVMNSSERVVPGVLEFVDIAGLIKGASEGLGLGNQFLANIRECDAIVHVVRCFDDDDILHVESSTDPVRDAEIIGLELVLADLAQLERRLPRAERTAALGKAEGKLEVAALRKIQTLLEEGKPVRAATLDDAEVASVRGLHFLTSKPLIYAANVDDDSLASGNDYSSALAELAAHEGSACVLVSACVESELHSLEEDERAEFLASLGVDDAATVGLNALARAVYGMLDLQTFYTTGPEESRAWVIPRGATTQDAAGQIHGDIAKKLVRTDVIGSELLLEAGSEAEARKRGQLRSEGRDYVVAEGECLHFHHTA